MGPFFDRIRKVLPPDELELFNEFEQHFVNMEQDLGVAQAKLDGSWPGWEWLPGIDEKSIADVKKWKEIAQL